MAAKKKTAKKAAKKAAKKGAGEHPCTLKDVCAFLDKLSPWLTNDLMTQITLLTNAVCNLDRVAIRGQPNIPGAMLCPGGIVAEPPVAPPPPKW